MFRATFWFIVYLSISSLAEDDPAKIGEELSADEATVASLCLDSQKALYPAAEDETNKTIGVRAIADLLRFEAEHRGSNVGLMAIRQIINMAATGGPVGGDLDIHRRNCCRALANYRDNDILPIALMYLHSGNPDPAIEGCLRDIIERSTSASNAGFARFLLARWYITIRDSRNYCQNRLLELSKMSEKENRDEMTQLSDVIDVMASIEDNATIEGHAIALLRDAIKDCGECRLPAVKAKAGNRYILIGDYATAKDQPKLSGMASGMLFREEHLRPGKPVGELKAILVDGTKWSLLEQLGKSVVIQFSSRGCQPCEEMYEDLTELLSVHNDKLEIITIVIDEDDEYALKQSDSGNLHWAVARVAPRSDIPTNWNIYSYPTVYVVSPNGRIVAENVRGKNLHDAVASSFN